MALRLYPPCKFVARNNEKMHLKCLAKNPEQKLIAVINKKYILYILDLESYREFLKKKTGSNNYALLNKRGIVNNIGIHIKLVYVNTSVDCFE